MDASLHPLHRHWENHRMNRIAILDAADRRVVLAEGAQRLKLLPVVLEKDFWVCWMLGLLFGRPERSEALVFKGGTALSKVFGVIQRFSEDIDLSVAPAILGFAEAEMDESMSRRRRGQLIENLEAACRQWVAERLQPELEQEITAVVGARPGGARWLEFETDTVTQSPVLYFHYPGTQEVDVPYIRRAVKLELGSLTDQRPVGRHRVRPWLAEVLPGPLAGMACDVVALDVGRAFWEKSTLFLSKFAVFPGTVIRVSYEAARISPVFRGFHSWNRNRGSGLGVVFSQRALHGISGETRRGCDVTRHMAEKQFHACLNLLWCESFRVKV